MNLRRIAAWRLAPNVLWLRAMLIRALAIGVCAVVAASCSGGSGSPDAGAGGSAGGTTGLAGSSGGRGGGGGSVGGGGGASAGTGGAAGAAGQGGGAGGQSGGAGGRGGGAAGQGGGGAGGRGGGAGGRGGGAGGSGGGAGGSGGVGVCGFASTYTIVDGGGLAPQVDTVTLSPVNAFRYERRIFSQDAGTISCMPAVPPCADPTPHIDASEVEAAIAHPDVQAALALTTRPIYGDRGIADGPSFAFTRADNRGFSAGIACNVPSATCNPIPAGVSALMQVVRMLVDQQLGDATCAQLR